MHPHRRTVLKGVGAASLLALSGIGTAAAQEDEAGLRVAHPSPDAPAVDVTVNDDALTLFEDLAFTESSGYAVVPAAEYEIEIRPASGGDPVFETTAPLEAGSTYTAFAVGYLSPDDEPTDEALGVVLSEDATAPPRGDGGGEGPPGDDERGPRP